jgi:hypothetical protein
MLKRLQIHPKGCSLDLYSLNLLLYRKNYQILDDGKYLILERRTGTPHLQFLNGIWMVSMFCGNWEFLPEHKKATKHAKLLNERLKNGNTRNIIANA